jgi:hypothetical protein
VDGSERMMGCEVLREALGISTEILLEGAEVIVTSDKGINVVWLDLWAGVREEIASWKARL